MYMKKAQIQMQFNWIYIAVVGAIILIAGLSIVPKIKKSATDSFNYDAKSYIDLILKNIQLNPKAQTTTELSGVEIKFDCESYTIDEISTPLSSIVFSPDKISGKMLGYSQYFEHPFKAELFGFVTSSNIKYVLKDSDFIQLINESLPNNMNKVIVQDYKESNNENYDKIRYIVLDTVPSISELGNLDGLKDEDVSVLVINIMDTLNSPELKSRFNGFFLEEQEKSKWNIFGFGTITYYKKQDNKFVKQGEIHFLDEASFIAAIYSESPQRHNCGMEKGFQKYSLSSAIKLNRINELSNIKHCPYLNPATRLTKLIELTSDIQHTNDFYLDIFYNGIILIKDNQVLLRLSCPLVY